MAKVTASPAASRRLRLRLRLRRHSGFFWKHASLHPTNNALLINFRLSSDAGILLLSTDRACKLAPNVQKTLVQRVRIPTELPFCMPTAAGWGTADPDMMIILAHTIVFSPPLLLTRSLRHQPRPTLPLPPCRPHPIIIIIITSSSSSSSSINSINIDITSTGKRFPAGPSLPGSIWISAQPLVSVDKNTARPISPRSRRGSMQVSVLPHPR